MERWAVDEELIYVAGGEWVVEGEWGVAAWESKCTGGDGEAMLVTLIYGDVEIGSIDGETEILETCIMELKRKQIKVMERNKVGSHKKYLEDKNPIAFIEHGSQRE